MMGGMASAGMVRSFEVKFESDLPNGPYGTLMGMTGVVHVPPGSTYGSVKEAILKTWIESKAGMATPSLTNLNGKHEDFWDIVSIKYKGGDVNLSEEVCATNCLEP
jgi:hypothetical protein